MADADRRKVFTVPPAVAAWLAGHSARTTRDSKGRLSRFVFSQGAWAFREVWDGATIAFFESDGPWVAVADEQGEIPGEVEPTGCLLPSAIADAIDRSNTQNWPVGIEAIVRAVVVWAYATFEPKRKES